MLNQKTIDVVKLTAPILQEHGELLTKHFYQRMFKHNPEVMPFFNNQNQADGTQQKALASAIAAYAANIDNLNALSGAVELIAQKHASLQIKPEHYPIVGSNLLSSIQEVLGDGATDEVIAAWGEAYQFLADILQGREQEIYDKNAQKPGGWKGFREFIIARKEQESSIISSFYLEPKDGGKVPMFLSGQYITIRVPTPDGSTTMRNYSLSNKPGDDFFRISVKREKNIKEKLSTLSVSNLLHHDFKVGDIVEVAPPCGDFFIDPKKQNNKPLVLIAAGVGITPIFSILLTALESMNDREITFIYGCLDTEVQAFKAKIDHLEVGHKNLKVHYVYSEPKNDGWKSQKNSSLGLITKELLASQLSTHDADYYFCGPKPFMVSIYNNLQALNVPESQMNFEFFGPKESLTA